MNVPTPNSEAKKPKQPTWPVNLGIGLATGIILGMLIASWGLRQENWQKAGFETVAAVMLVIVFVITALATFGTAFMRNGFRCSRWAIVIAISILALILIGVELFLEPTRVQRASITKLIVSGAKVLYEKENEPGLAAFFGRQYFENVTFVIWDCKEIAQPDLTYLHGLNSVNTLILENVKCPPTDLEPLRLTNLQYLGLQYDNITDQGLKHL
ncbi:MAG: hypothetical protein ABSE63_16930, partial [Thermoguttaceae bacterium]